MSRLFRQNDRPLKFNNGRFSQRLVTDSDGKNHLILFDAELMKKVPHISTLLIDATFDPTPNLTDATQLLVVHAATLGHGSPNHFPFLKK